MKELAPLLPRRVALASLLRMLLALAAPFASFLNEKKWIILGGLMVEAMVRTHLGMQSLMLSLYRNEPIKEWIRGNMEQLNLLDNERTDSTVVTTRHILASKLTNLYTRNRRAKLMGYSFVILAHCLLYEGVCVMNDYHVSYNSMAKLDALYHFGYVLSLILVISELWKLVISQLSRSSCIKSAVQIVLLTINRIYNSPNNTGNNQAGGVSSKFVVNTHDCMIKSLLRKTEDTNDILMEISNLTDVEMRSDGSTIVENNSKFGNYDELNEIENDINAVEVAIIEGCQQGAASGEDASLLSYEDRIISKASSEYKVSRGDLRYFFFLWCLLIFVLLLRSVPLYSYVVSTLKSSFLPIIPMDYTFLVAHKVEQVINAIVMVTIVFTTERASERKRKSN